jgi:hypothetical protein
VKSAVQINKISIQRKTPVPNIVHLYSFALQYSCHTARDHHLLYNKLATSHTTVAKWGYNNGKRKQQFYSGFVTFFIPSFSNIYLKEDHLIYDIFYICLNIFGANYDIHYVLKPFSIKYKVN